MMVSADVVTSGASQGDWFWISVFFFLMWAISIILIEKKNRKIKILKEILKTLK